MTRSRTNASPWSVGNGDGRKTWPEPPRRATPRASIHVQTAAWNEYAAAKSDLDSEYTYQRRERARIAFNKFASTFDDSADGPQEIPSHSKWGMPE